MPKEILAAIGGIAVESTWVEVVAASFYAFGLEDALRIVGRPGEAFRKAKAAISAQDDEAWAERAREWLEEAKRLVTESRHPVVHGLAHYDDEGQWHSVHPQTGDVRALNVEELESARVALDHHAGMGWGIALEFWLTRPAD